MNNTNTALVKTCTSCGQIKPLSAFLQLTGVEGTTYGSVCSACRKTELEKAKKKEFDDLTTSTSGKKIDAKMRVKDTADKLQQHKQVEDEYFDERDKDEVLENKKIENIRQNEQKHRSFLDKRTQTFLDSKTSKTAEKVFGGEEHRAKEEKLDFSSGPFEDTRVAGKVKYTQSSVFRAFKDRLPNAPIVSAEERSQRAEKNKQAVTDLVKENMHPTRSRGR